MKIVSVGDKTFEMLTPDEDCILQWGYYVPYTESNNPEMYVVLHDYIFWSARLQDVVVVPRWFTTDLASIPKVARVLVSKSGKSKIPALVHDMLYFMHSNYPDKVTYSRKTADLVLKDFCKQQKMSSIKTSLVYLGVRVGGSEAFTSIDDPFLPEHLKTAYMDRYYYLPLESTNGEIHLI